MNINAAFVGDYLRADQIQGKTPTVTIRDVKMVELEDEKGKVRGRPVVYFAETKRGWVLNRTNAQALAAMFGVETSEWKNRQVTIYAAQVQLGREKTLGVRVAGSPELTKALTFDLKLPRKKAQRVTLKPTPKGEVVVPEEPSEVPEEAPASDAPPPDDVPGWNAGGDAP